MHYVDVPWDRKRSGRLGHLAHDSTLFKNRVNVMTRRSFQHQQILRERDRDIIAVPLVGRWGQKDIYLSL